MIHVLAIILKWTLLTFVTAAVLVFLLQKFLPDSLQEQQFDHLPWQVEVRSPEATAVLGLVLGETRLEDLTQSLPVPDIRLFVDPNGRRSVEAYYANARVPPFEANIVLIPDLTEEEFDFLWSERTSERPMPSGARRYGLSDDALRSLGSARVVEMTYAPRARWDAELIEARFGSPESRLRIGEDQDWWLYPEHGLALMVPIGRGRASMHYVTQERWPGVLQRLEREGMRQLGLEPSDSS